MSIGAMDMPFSLAVAKEMQSQAMESQYQQAMLEKYHKAGRILQRYIDSRDVNEIARKQIGGAVQAVEDASNET